MTYKYGVGRIGEVVWKSNEVGDAHFTKYRQQQYRHGQWESSTRRKVRRLKHQGGGERLGYSFIECRRRDVVINGILKNYFVKEERGNRIL